MSSWAEVKYALNDTIGTNDFKPLNKIMIENKELVSDNENKLFSAYLIEDDFSGEQAETPVANIKMYLGGKAKFYVKATTYKTATSTAYHPTIKIYVNNVLKDSVTIHSYTASQTASSGQINEKTSSEITVKNGDVVTVKFFTDDTSVSSSSRTVFSEISILGKITERVAFDYTEE